MLLFAAVFLAGFLAGSLTVYLLKTVKGGSAKDLARELFRETESERRAEREAVIREVENSFGSLSLNALSKASAELMKTAREKLSADRELQAKELEGKKILIDQQLERMSGELGHVSGLIKELEQDRAEKFGELTNQLKNMNEQAAALSKATLTLKEALSNSRVRGQWGQRMAEDVLRIAGFIENINYLKEKTIESAGTRPDFTFLLPRGLKLNMDVKFPWENYVRYLESEGELDRARYRGEFLKDVRSKVKEVTAREYINPEENTLDYVLLFIPNEQVYSFIHESERSLWEEALASKVVFCSPITLFAVLAVIRQAVDNFALEKTAHEILSLLGTFKKQWGEFLKKLKTLGDRLDDARREFDALTTTRKRMLERPLEKIDALREQRGIEPALESGADPLADSEKIEDPVV